MTTTRSLDQQFEWEGEAHLQANLKALMRVLEARFVSFETIADSMGAAETEMRDIAFARINDVLTPAIESILHIQDLGFLQAHSVSAIILEVDDEVMLILDNAEQAQLFHPGPFVTIQHDLDHENYAFARVMYYERETGSLSVKLLEVGGAPGPFSAWTITAGTAVALSVFDARALLETAADDADESADAAAASAASVAGAAAAAAASAAAAAASAAEAEVLVSTVDNSAYAQLASPPFTGSPSITGAAGASWRWTVTNNAGAGRNWWVQADTTNFYILRDGDGDGDFDTPHPLYFANATGIANFGFTPVFPTATAGDNTTKGATTAFVQTALGGRQAVNAKLTAIAGSAWTAGRFLYQDTTTTLAEAVVTPQALTLLDDTNALAQRTTLGAIGNLLRISRLTASNASFAFLTDTRTVLIKGVGGGGGGGSVTGGGASNASAGMGGSGGAYVEKYFDKPVGTANIQVGTAGAFGTGGGDGGNGGNSTYSDGTNSCTATGGSGGTQAATGGTSAIFVGCTLGPTPTGGAVNIAGGNATGGICIGGTMSVLAVARGGGGGDTPFGRGGLGGTARASTSASDPGNTGTGWGSGGGGGAIVIGTGSPAGGTGRQGYWEVWEFG